MIKVRVAKRRLRRGVSTMALAMVIVLSLAACTGIHGKTSSRGVNEFINGFCFLINDIIAVFNNHGGGFWGLAGIIVFILIFFGGPVFYRRRRV